MGLIQTVAPVAEPITTAEAKTHLRIDISDDDTYIDTLIESARLWAEKFTRRSFINSTWEWKLDGFPSGRSPLEPPISKLASVTSITYTDADGNTGTTWNSANYDVDTTSIVGRIVPAYSKDYPDTRSDIDSVTVTFLAGYGASAAQVPLSIKQAIKLIVGHWYENREEVVIGAGRPEEVPLSAQRLLTAYRVMRLPI